MENTKNNHIKHWETRKRTGTILKNGYRHCSIYKIRKYEHRRIMETFLGRELKIEEHVHHKNGNRLDNRLENLELLNRSEHMRMHALKKGLGKDRLGISPTNKTSQSVIDDIIQMRKKGFLLREIQEKTGLSYITVQKYARQIFEG